MSLVIDSRFRGPRTSGNGGYTAGLVAASVPGVSGRDPVTVTLRRPPPLDRPLPVSVGDDAVLRATDGDELVVEAARARPEDAVVVGDLAVEPVSADEARALGTTYPGLTDHPFPECFVCGPARAAGDGLRLFPGRVGDGRTACVWDVAPDLAGRTELVWAALDCPGGWTAPIEGRPMVLGRITASVDADLVPAAGDACVVMGRFAGSEGRKVWTHTTVYAPGGVVIGRAHATWIVLPS